MRLLEQGKWALLLATIPVTGLALFRLSCFYPESLDSVLFGPMGANVLGFSFALFSGGCLSSGLVGAYPIGALEALAPVPSAAPIHVFALLGAGFFDLSTDQNLAVSPLLSLVALLLGGLWSRRLGPHKEAWSWDVVEITALDLLTSELAAEHLWQKRPMPVGAAWGGGEVRLFRSGLTASHHHLSVTGFCSHCLKTWYQSLGALIHVFGLPLLFWKPSSLKVQPVRIQVYSGHTRAYGGPVAFGEASLAAWAVAFLAPSSGAVAAWGLWGAPLYLWLFLTPPLIYLGALATSPQSPLWAHYPLIPLAHIFASPLPWAPCFLPNRFVGAPIWQINLFVLEHGTAYNANFTTSSAQHGSPLGPLGL